LVLCSRNAHPEKGLVRRAHLDQHGCPSKRGEASKLGRINQMDDGRSMRAMETTLAVSLNTGEGVGLVGRTQCPIPASSGLVPTNQVTGDVKIHVFHHVIHAISLARSLRASYNWLP